MPNKTDRIVDYLPLTFLKRPRGQTLHAVLDAFGRELQDAENSLAAVMQSHWVDYADRLAAEIDDLAKISALYGLAPRPDEGVEEFREHLKRYVRTFLEGTVTVQGIFRIAAEALGLHLADEYIDLDTWWQRATDSITITEPVGKDAAEEILGFRTAHERGQSASAAAVQGTVDISAGVDCRIQRILRLEVDGTGPFEIDLSVDAEDPGAVSGEHIVARINTEVGLSVAAFDGRFLSLTSLERGPSSNLEVQDVLDDAAEQVLGLPPRTYYGLDESAAVVRGTVDLSGVLDLSEARYLRLLIDGEHLAEIDCAGPDESHTLLDQVVEKINTALGLEVVTHDGQFLTLTSPSVGLGSSIVFQQAAAQQALVQLFGPISLTHIGRGPKAARVVGRPDLSSGVDLNVRSLLQLRLDGIVTPVIDCAGLDPANTQLPELVTAINEAAGAQIASHDGSRVSLLSTTAGSASEIVFLTPEPEEAEATELIFGVGPRAFTGHAATPASLVGTTDLSDGVDLIARYWLQLSVDGHPPVTVDLRTHAEDIRAATPRELADAIDAATGADVGTTDGQHLILVSATEGSGSSLSVEPLAEEIRSRFVSRALVTDEAATAIFGYTDRVAQGKDATNARVLGQTEVLYGVDLTVDRYLRLVIDDYPPAEIDCTGARPRATLIDEIVENINEQLSLQLGLTQKVASHNGRQLLLVSHTLGANSRIRFESPRTADALALLLNVAEGEYRGQNAEQVRLVGTVDLSGGGDLTAGDKIKLGLDGADPVEITCTANAADPERVTLNELVIAINLALGRNVASHNGKFLQINSPTIGADSQLQFIAPDTGDATLALFGFSAPRSYHGRDASPAEIVGAQDLSGGVNLQIIRFLRLGVDGGPVQDVDCLLPSAVDPANVTLDEIVAAINAALEAKVASHDDVHLILTSSTLGEAGRIRLEPHSSGDARQILFGDVAEETTGADAQPAVLLGEVDMLQPVNLSQRDTLRLAVDDGVPADIPVSGVASAATFLGEIVDAINAIVPDLASETVDRRLLLSSPTVGQDSRLELLPLRTLDLIEYPPADPAVYTWDVRHGDRWTIDNLGAAPGHLTAHITAPQGVAGPMLVNEQFGWRVRLLVGLGMGETARLWVQEGRLCAETVTTSGLARRISGQQMLVGPLGAQTWVPFEGQWTLSGDESDPPSLQLNNPLADGLLVLHARDAIVDPHDVKVAVTESEIPEADFDPVREDAQLMWVAGRVQEDVPGYWQLVDGAGDPLLLLRAGPGVSLAAYQGQVVNVFGTIHPDEAEPLLIAHRLENLFNVTLTYGPEEGEPVVEQYPGVTIGLDPSAPDSLDRRIQSLPSRLVRGETSPKAAVLDLPIGRSTWRFHDCYGPRFNHAMFNESHFPGGVCLDRGVLNVSRFVHSPPEPVRAVFTSLHDPVDPPVVVEFIATRYQAGAFELRLPADLPDRFGGRFNQTRFGQGLDNPQEYPQSVTEPPADEAYLVAWVNRDDPLVEAQIVPRVPLGWEPVPMPFREPQHLTLGDTGTPAQIFLTEPGIIGFLRIQAREPGDWGNRIAVSARTSGPAQYDFSVIYAGVPFENARQTVTGNPLEVLTQASLEPGPVGVLQAKGAGIHAKVTRARTPEVGD